LFSLSLSPPLLLPLLTPNKQMEEGVVECGQLLCWFAVVVGARARLPFSFSQFKFGERGYRLAGGVVLNRKKHLWGFSFDNGWRDWVLPWSVSVGVSEDWGFFSFFCGGPFSRWSQFCLLAAGQISCLPYTISMWGFLGRFFVEPCAMLKIFAQQRRTRKSGQKNTYPFTICEFLFGNVLLRHLLC
jgi:hypothetical protein